MTSLRDRTVAEIERREQTARAANFSAEPESWTARPVMPPITTGKRGNAEIRDSEGDLLADVATVQDAEHIALHDPADALRRYAHYRRILDRHVIVDADTGAGDRQPYCRGCGYTPSADEDCPDVTDIADTLGLPTSLDLARPGSTHDALAAAQDASRCS